MFKTLRRFGCMLCCTELFVSINGLYKRWACNYKSLQIKTNTPTIKHTIQYKVNHNPKAKTAIKIYSISDCIFNI